MRPKEGDRLRTPTAMEWAKISAILDSLRRISPPRPDSINNGADDDGSGSVAVLEIAQALASGARPRRSVLFVWHTGEEGGLLGSAWFADNPTVGRDSIVRQLNMEHGRRGPDSFADQPRTLQIIVSRRSRLSWETRRGCKRLPRYGRSLSITRTTRRDIRSIDTVERPYNYARRGIPISYFSLGTTSGTTW